MVELRDLSGLSTTHQTYTMLQAVLQVFRARLTFAQAIAFVAVLPPVLRAIFVSDWDVDAPRRDFASREAMTAEVRALRPDHNFSTASAILDVATVLRRHVDREAFERAIVCLPDGARAFWDA
ncbi:MULTISPECIES: DUF2267 domain-containing protein [Alphaproteobacteria]|uniref:DUF2267 domain-containing protein n=2 Tax=Alphaproteobacteria TaxID=28211 RepID=A0A512HCP5_9HYPH|nr:MULTISPECIES: DUF2267 domain-containing protein [Alphaproteobacteria]GEO83229.1 hypothetical protein RNA01_01610 [Ciceribacter naphthalenivorans]GLR20376.1 hypothetical protein GCM10007920_01600 [Ciceribacter naphthalenivorans]GLT03232.1 hypothetical protein GCM10007926_01600 [Sphingomonas psychrolutea]